jgi:hypothetical protein
MLRLKLFAFAIALTWIVPSAAVEAQVGRGRQERQEDRIERRTERQLNRSQQGFYFNDITWTQVEPWLQQYGINPLTVRTRPDAAVTAAYGFVDQTPDDDWFYDYYDYGYSYYYPAHDTHAAYGFQYYDRDGDGVYDAYYSTIDADNDGVFDTVDEFRFGVEAAAQPPRAESEMTVFNPPQNADPLEVSGAIVAVKTGKVRSAEHLLVEVGGEGQENAIAVDLGPTSEVSVQIKVGDELRARGRYVEMGDKNLFVAHEIVLNGETIAINRRGEPIVGTIVESRPIEVRGVPHVMAVVMVGEEHKLVDLGPEAELKVDLRPETEIQIYGTPVTLRDRPVVMAHEIMYNGNEIRIARPVSVESPQR